MKRKPSGFWAEVYVYIYIYVRAHGFGFMLWKKLGNPLLGVAATRIRNLVGVIKRGLLPAMTYITHLEPSFHMIFHSIFNPPTFSHSSDNPYIICLYYSREPQLCGLLLP